ncbi:patatin-like phospholipase family protein [Roseomonas sp. CCTCC AB2023176]|uniref:patatin-like phospholipase family protein n=1 Tax=Roseomonas sp. CCTCC AB2023176 TaxID=3342640 RepID=UPI0035DEF699
MPIRAAPGLRPDREPAGAWRSSVAAALLVCALSACSSILRQPPPPADTTIGLAVLGVPNGRFWPDGSPDDLMQEALLAASRQAERFPASRRGPERLPPQNLLAVSGGGDNGAYGAGLIVGWTASGNRPEFDVVTGISAGALIAPFAFLGSAYDGQLREVFTANAPGDILVLPGIFRTVIGAAFGEAIADTSPLYRLIQRHADMAMLDAIAREYRRGRLLLIGTTNLDLQRPVVWNIGAIAASGHPDALSLFRRILLASASIPGAFPPVLIDVESDGRTYQEMHVDGGAATQVFLYPPSLQLARIVRQNRLARDRTVWVIRNGRMDVEGATTARGVFSIATRSVSTLLHFSGIGDINRIYLTALRDGVAFRLSYIDSAFRADRSGPFDQGFMQALFEHGYEKGRAERGWVTEPPSVTSLPPSVAPAAAVGNLATRRMAAPTARTPLPADAAGRPASTSLPVERAPEP